VEVIGAGLGRTGTMSLKVALEQLGLGPCHHAIEIFNDPARVPLWEAALDGQPIGWDRLLAGYRSTVDWPACTHYEELIEVYPRAKVVLTVRDPERWYESVRTTIYDIHGSSDGPGFMPPMEETPPEIRPARELMDRVIFRDTFGNRFGERSHAIEVFEAHNAEVERRVPAERLLVYEVREGWAPLCDFLEVAVPDAPFPHLNDREAFMKLVDERTEAAAQGK
jgi:hypothetical protein